MDRVHVLRATADGRRRIARLIGDLDEAELATPSLCAGWDVKTVAAHLLSVLEVGTHGVMWLGLRRGGPDRAFDELARRTAQLPASEIAARLDGLADRRYWRFPPQAPGLLAEVLAHTGDITIPLGRPFDTDPELIAIAMDFLTGPLPLGLVPLGRLRGIGWHATDSGRKWGIGKEIRGSAAELMMAAVGRISVLDSLDGPGVPVLRQRCG
jgi:uncharacterized protein (TIGR03083 family)